MARVLLAERDQRIGDFIAGILAEFGHIVTLCADAGEAGVHLAAEPIDVVLTDMMLQDSCETGFARDWQALEVPMVTLTGRVFSVDQSAPAPTPLLDKPFRFADLRCVVNAIASCTADDRVPRPAILNAA